MEKDNFDIKAFNRGYLLAKHRPELASKVKPSLDKEQSPQMIALLKGVEKAQQEKLVGKNKNYTLPSLTSIKKTIQKSKDQDLEK